MRPIVQLDMLIPFDDSFDELTVEKQLVSLKGCVLCRITSRLDEDSMSPKPEWRACKKEIGVPIRVFRLADAPERSRLAARDRAPAIVAIDDQGNAHEMLDQERIAQCNGRVADLRGRLKYRAAMLGLALEG